MVDQSVPLAVDAFVYCKGSDGTLYARTASGFLAVRQSFQTTTSIAASVLG